jgi:hypothetical protein
VAIPTWISAGDRLPKAVTMDNSFKSPICKAALTFKAKCFPLTYDRGLNYINLSVLINQQNNGYMQLLKPIEEEIFRTTNSLIAEMENGRKTEKDISILYGWIDKYLSDKYKEQFDLNLF